MALSPPFWGDSEGASTHFKIFPMNYIKHMTSFFSKVSQDTRLNPSHVSLYMALFQLWNMNRFLSPFILNRADAMMLSRIGSLNTYHKCMHELNEYGYIEYSPSHNPMVGSLVNMFIFDTTSDTSIVQPLRQPRRKNDTTADTSSAPFYKHTKHLNKTRERDNSHSQVKIFNSPNQYEVEQFFKSESFPAVEAQIFFNHYQSNGWKMGCKTSITDWQAAARKWMLNGVSSKKQPSPIKINNNKNYAEPL